MIKISIVIPTYKRPKFVVDAINSCLNQTYPAHEIIIGDDSPDNITSDIIKTFQDSSKVTIRYIHNNPALRQASNVNMLFKQASGDKLMLLHDDDLLLPNALETLTNCFLNDQEVNVAYGKQFIMTDDGTISEPRSITFNDAFYRTGKYEGSALTSLEAGMVQQFPNNAYLIDTKLAQQVGYREVGDVCDFDFGFRVGQTSAKIFFVNTYTAKYRISDLAVSTGKLNDAGLISYLMVKNTAVPEASLLLKNKWLKSRAAVAVGQAIANQKIETAVEIYFSKDHLNKVFTLGGAKRILSISLIYLRNRVRFLKKS